jgi:hypothetical protein
MRSHDAHRLPISFREPRALDERQRKLAFAIIVPVIGVGGISRDRIGMSRLPASLVPMQRGL